MSRQLGSIEEIMKVGDWADCFEGIGKIVSIHEIYADGIDVINGTGHKLGEHTMNIVVYKMFCGFEGKVRKRSHFLSCNESLCTELCEESNSVLEKLKVQEPEAYEKFLAVSPKKSFGDWQYLYIPYDDSFLSQKDEVEEISENISKPFTYIQYKKSLQDTGFDVERKLVQPSVGSRYVTLSFYNEGYLHKDKERLYSRVNCTEVGVYA